MRRYEHDATKTPIVENQPAPTCSVCGRLCTDARGLAVHINNTHPLLKATLLHSQVCDSQGSTASLSVRALPNKRMDRSDHQRRGGHVYWVRDFCSVIYLADVSLAHPEFVYFLNQRMDRLKHQRPGGRVLGARLLLSDILLNDVSLCHPEFCILFGFNPLL